jgi:hypothetical protein
MYGGALQRMLARAEKFRLGSDLLTWSDWTDETQIADELSLALGLPGTIRGDYDRNADVLAHVTQGGTVAVTWRSDAPHFAPLRAEGFKLGSKPYVGLLAFVSPLRCLAVPANAAAHVVLATQSACTRDARDAMLLLDAAASKAWPEVSRALDRRRAGSIHSAAAARMRKLGAALGRDAVQPCEDLVSLASIGQGTAIIGVGQVKVATS